MRQWADSGSVEASLTLSFEGDLPNGNCEVTCGFCHRIFELTKEIEECPHCLNDIIFASWHSW